MAFIYYYKHINKISDYEVKIFDSIKCTIHKNINEVADIISKHAGNKTKFHDSLQKYLCGMSMEYKFESSIEHIIINGKMKGRIDVVWKDGDNIICAIEIDSSRRVKSVKKLKSVNAINKIWIVYVEEIDGFMEFNDEEKEIYVINLGNLFSREK